MTPPLTYATCLHMQGRQRFLLWAPGDEPKPDHFVSWPGEPRLLVADSLPALQTLATRCGHVLADEVPGRIDFDAMLRALAGLRDDRAPSTSTATHLLDGWNTLEDLARSLGVPVEPGNDEEAAILEKAYRKVFHGSNLPSLTPQDCSYHPLFNAGERRLLRRHLRGLWADILRRAGETGAPLASV